MKNGVKKYLTASSILIGSCIGAGVLGIPYVAAQSGFFIALIYLILIGAIIFLVNLYLGEIVLRTKGDHQLIGYVEKYLGKRARHVMEFAVIFGNGDYYIYFGALFGFFMSFLLKGGMKSLKKFEKIGVTIILVLLLVIVGLFLPGVEFVNLLGFNSANILLPFGVVLFALMSFQAIPEIKIVLKRNEKHFKKVMMTGTLISLIFYILFTFVVVGIKGLNTPDVATLALGPVFVVLGIFTMFTSYLSGGNALRESFQFDERFSKKKSWILASFVPIGLFFLTQLTNFFSFTRILSLGGVVSGGIMAVLILLMVKKAKIQGNRKPEYIVSAKWWILGLLILIFLFGIISEVFI